MSGLYPEIEPFAKGMLEVGGGDLIYWELCGNPSGKPAIVLHGGPGSGCNPWHRRLFDPAAYRIVLFDQRGCGRSRPHASLPETELSRNTTENLISDMELLRIHLHIERWLVLGGSWGSALALAYAEQFSTCVTELILFGVTTGRREEFDWLFRDGLGMLFPKSGNAAAMPCRWLSAMEISSRLTVACCGIPILWSVNGLLLRGVCGSRRLRIGLLCPGWRHDSKIRSSRWRLRGLLRITFITMGGLAMDVSCVTWTGLRRFREYS
jgi:pimeloyl-ACP methyl ester carboxylesterase